MLSRFSVTLRDVPGSRGSVVSQEMVYPSISPLICSGLSHSKVTDVAVTDVVVRCRGSDGAEMTKYFKNLLFKRTHAQKFIVLYLKNLYVR